MSWQVKTWEEVLTIRNGKSQKKVVNQNGKYPIYGSGGIMGFADDYLCDKNTTIIGRKGSINKPIFVEEKFWNVDTAFGLIPSDELDNKFFYYFCTTYNFFKHNKATTLPSLTKKDLLKIEIPLPPLDQQKKIAAILDAADAYRQKTKALIEKYDELTQSLFIDMFGDPFNGKVCLLKSNITITGGYAFKSKDFVSEGVPLIKIGTVNKGYFDTDNFSYLPESYLSKYQKWVVKKGDVLMSLTGTVGKDDYGNVEEVTDYFDNYLLNQRVAKLEPSNNIYLKGFIFNMLKNIKTKNKLTKISRGVRQANISNRDIENLEMITPSIEEQKKYISAVANIEEQKAQAQASLAGAEDLFNSLLQRAFKGELTT